MSFASLDFVLFFLIIIAVTLVLQRFKNTIYKELFLLASSYFFYGYWDWRFCFLLFFVTVSSYVTALFVEKKWVFVVGTVIPLVVLGFFKYFNFFLTSFGKMINAELGVLSIILPVGISFYTFQALSYVIDVKRGKMKAERSFIKLALYISFFPQLVAGPIVKAADFLPQLREDRRITLKNMEYGLQLVVFGFIKKMVISDHLSVFIDDVFKSPSAYSWISIVLAVVSYSIQIYLDFSGYSDIAIGCAKCLGYDFCPNFNLPYMSENITVFWRRWHISLSTWLKEYLYIPLGGNRKGRRRQLINLFLTMLLGGLWHGASWTFVFWGALHGVALCIDKLISKKRREKTKAERAIGILGTFSFVSFAWIFFRADTFDKAWQIIKGMFTFQSGIVQLFSWTFVAIVAITVATACAIYRARREKTEINGFYPLVRLDTVRGLTVFFCALGAVLALAFTGEQPFVYFQF